MILSEPVLHQEKSKTLLTFSLYPSFGLFHSPLTNKHYRGVPHATVIQRLHNQIVMGTCPYCQSVTYTGDTICYSCGRILANIRSDKFAMEQQFHRGSLDTTFKMTNKPTKGGVVQTHTGRNVNIMKNRRNRTRHLVLLFFVAFIMLAPQVRENIFQKWAPGIQEYVMLMAETDLAVYDNVATFTVDRTIVVTNSNSVGWLYEDIVIPTDVESLYGQDTDFSYVNGDLPSPTSIIQEVKSVNLLFTSGGSIIDDMIAIPTDGSILSYEDKTITSKGHYVWWPGYGADNKSCHVGNCVKLELHLQPGETAVFSFQATVTSTSYSWWDGSRVDTIIDGLDEAINVDNSGTFSDIELRGGGERSQDFSSPYWYDRGTRGGVTHGYAINAQEQVVLETAELISSSLPEGLQDNAYAYARATFDYMHKHITYDKNAPNPARSGPLCLEESTGDCDEQTNAFLSLLRVKDIPGWYVFGALTGDYDYWEAHGWGYIMLPMSESWCESQNIELDTCFVEGSVDVVNNKWLLHTPNAYIAWVEDPDSTGTLLNSYYSPGKYSSNGLVRAPPHYSTIGDVDTSGGKYQVKPVKEILR